MCVGLEVVRRDTVDTVGSEVIRRDTHRLRYSTLPPLLIRMCKEWGFCSGLAPFPYYFIFILFLPNLSELVILRVSTVYSVDYELILVCVFPIHSNRVVLMYNCVIMLRNLRA